MRAVVIGFPKSGTFTVQKALAMSDLRAVHQFYDASRSARWSMKG